ncbi:hypothetical protein [Elusimicrobium posterum]|uniref:hypothetical protein n=1 Tax=Elusimicrobium posterum TaxID=3116653 RepID=UPI003C78974E
MIVINIIYSLIVRNVGGVSTLIGLGAGSVINGFITYLLWIFLVSIYFSDYHKNLERIIKFLPLLFLIILAEFFISVVYDDYIRYMYQFHYKYFFVISSAGLLLQAAATALLLAGCASYEKFKYAMEDNYVTALVFFILFAVLLFVEPLMRKTFSMFLIDFTGAGGDFYAQTKVFGLAALPFNIVMTFVKICLGFFALSFVEDFPPVQENLEK